MCILFVYTDPSPPEGGYRLIVASNRDEYYTRPAKEARHEQNIIGGTDMELGKEGGMWFGVSLQKSDNYRFRLGCILNVTGEDRVDELEGRGVIVLNYLKDDVQAKDYAEVLKHQTYNAYNFISIELWDTGIDTRHQSNRPVSCSKYDGKQVLGFGNSTTSVPLQKVLHGRTRFEEIVRSYGSATKDELVEQLTQLLKHEERFLPDDELRRRSAAYECLSSIYVKILEAKYGTRTHTIVLVDYDWNMDFVEVTMKQPIDAEQPVWTTRHFKAPL